MAKVKTYGICLYRQSKESHSVLLGKSFFNDKWGFLKGCIEPFETPRQAAQREFFEESGIFIETRFFEDYLYQENEQKDVGIYLVNAANIQKLEKYFENDCLKEIYQTSENENVKFFDIKKLPKIKSKQSKLIKKVIEVLKSN